MSKVSVLIPVFDGAAVIDQAVENILRQTRLPAEIVIADDGSRDGLATRIDALRLRCEASDVTLRYVGFAENRGRGAARNLALDSSTGDLVAWFDVDDLWSPAKLAVQTEFFKRLRFDHPSRRLLLTCAYYRYDAAFGLAPQVISPPSIIGIDDIVSLYRRRHIQLQTVFGPRDTFLQHRFDAELNRVEDFDFAVRFAAAGGKFANGDSKRPPLVHYFRSGANQSDETAACNKRIVHKHRAIFQANHIDPEAFLSKKLEVLRAVEPLPLGESFPALEPGPIHWRRNDNEPLERLSLALLPDGGLRIEAAQEGGWFVVEDADRAEIGRHVFRAVAEIPHFQLVDWFMAGGRRLHLLASSGPSTISKRLRIGRTSQGLISVAR